MTEVTNNQILTAILENQKDLKAIRSDVQILKGEFQIIKLRLDRLEETTGV